MKLGELFIELGIKGNIDPLKEALSVMKKVESLQKSILKNRKALKNATSEEEKALKNAKSVEEKALKNAKSVEEKALKEKNSANKTEIENTQKLVEKTEQARQGYKNMVGGILGVVIAIGAGVLAFDRMANAMFKANQQIINFNRQMGISFTTLNKYASASAMVNYGATIEGTANSLQTLASNLWDIRMGRGDISPYQELAFVGGKGINPVGKSVEQVIEEVRSAIKGVDDLQATNLITRMGFSPDDLLMLRMTREEFEKVNSLFLNPSDREAMNGYAKQLKIIHLEFSLLYNKILLKVMPLFIDFIGHLKDMAEMWTSIGNNIYRVIEAMPFLANSFKALAVTLTAALWSLNPLLVGLGSLYLLIEDIAVYFMGGKSVLGIALEGLKNLGPDLAEINPFSGNDKGLNGFIQSISKLNALSVPPILQALIQTGFAIDKMNNGKPFNGMLNKPIEWITDKMLTNPTQNSSKTFNQNNNISFNGNGAVVPQVADTIAQYTSVIGQNIAYG